jgi:CRISPR/Cas system CMR subunit Cmr4 (Cas7 group RAMP superfamily)
MLDELSGKDIEYVPEEEDKVAEPKPRETIKEFIDRATPEELEDFRQKNAALDMSDEGRRLREEKEQQSALDEANKILTVLEANKSLAPVQYVQLTEDIKNGDIKSLRDLKEYRKIYDIITNKQAEPTGVITEEDKEFTPVGGRLINKADVAAPEVLMELLRKESNAYAISARTGYGIETLVKAIESSLPKPKVEINAVIPFNRGDLVSAVHEQGEIISEEYLPEGTKLHAMVGGALARKIELL